jgi:hypothetical protein
MEPLVEHRPQEEPAPPEPVRRDRPAGDQLRRLRPTDPQVRGSLIDSQGIRVRVGTRLGHQYNPSSTVGPPTAGLTRSRSRKGESWTAASGGPWWCQTAQTPADVDGPRWTKAQVTDRAWTLVDRHEHAAIAWHARGRGFNSLRLHQSRPGRTQPRPTDSNPSGGADKWAPLTMTKRRGVAEGGLYPEIGARSLASSEVEYRLWVGVVEAERDRPPTPGEGEGDHQGRGEASGDAIQCVRDVYGVRVGEAVAMLDAPGQFPESGGRAPIDGRPAARVGRGWRLEVGAARSGSHTRRAGSRRPPGRLGVPDLRGARQRRPQVPGQPWHRCLRPRSGDRRAGRRPYLTARS